MLLAALAFLLPFENAWAVCPTLNPSITHRLSVSYCELCGVGSVTLRFTYPGNGNPDLTDLVITENLGASGLTYVPGTTVFAVNYGAAPAAVAPSVSGPNGSVLTWDLGSYVLQSAQGGGPGNAQFLDVTFQVRRADSVSQEGLVTANRSASASISYVTTNEPPNFEACDDTRSSGSETLPLREPLPQIIKRGRNVDAGQTGYSDPLYGHNNDDVIWRIEIRNNGLAGMQDVRFDDLMQGTDNLIINYACPTAGAAVNVANNNGVLPGGSPCVSASNTIDDFVVTAPFGNAGSSNFASPYTGLNGFEVDVNAQGSAFIYLVGKIRADGSCIDSRTNTVSDVQWGCGIEPPAGGITTTSTGVTPGDTARLVTRYGNGAGGTSSNAVLTVNRQLTGTNTAQPVGSKGTMTITVTNSTGGSVKNIRLQDVLPAEYVVDPTFTPTATMAPAYGNAYPGMIDTITWTNPVPGTFPLTTTDPTIPLGNTAPEFTLSSTTVHSVYADQRDMMRHGDVLTIRFRVVLIRPASYDKVADIDVRTEITADGTDPTHVTQLSNTLTVDFDTLCTDQGAQQRVLTGNGTGTNGGQVPANPEDLDVDIVGNELIFILTNDPSYPLPLTVQLRNNGGHDAADYRAYASFGATMEVVSAPAGCAVTTNPPPLAVWTDPVPIPTAPVPATVYQCTGTPIPPGQTRLLNFEVIKSSDPARIAADDLTFRADVVGEITLSNGTPLWFPAPTPRPDGVTDRANNYSLDAVRARVIGFNLLKSQVGTCSENNPPPSSPDRQVQIGEECTYHVDTGGWFGFQTPGFTYIAVQRIQVVDELPDGQGYISSTDPYAASTSAILGVSLNPPGLAPLNEGWIDWTFNQIVPGQRIMERDHWFRVDLTTRLLNDPIDASSAPNQHAATSTNILNSTFQAVFYNDNTNQEEVYDLGQNTVGYPQQAARRIDLTVTEPHLTVVKEVCNETLYGIGPACSNWTTLADDGDAYNRYLYRLRVTNEAASAGVTRAPAYDVVVTDRLDASDLAYVLPFTTDALDNDGDGLIGGGDADGEGTVSDNVVNNGVPGTITFSYTHSTGLRRIDPGQSVTLYYRVDYDDDAAPMQTFTNTAEATYDSLTGASGSQSAPQRPNSDIGGARVYRTQPDSAAVRIIPVVTQPKRIVRLSSTPVSGTSPQPVSVGEEVEYELVTSIPVALLRSFVIRDELPAGIRCAQAPAVDLGPTGPHAAAGFQPGGVITPTCTDSLVEWNFGNQRVTNGTSNNRYDFAIRFIARVENTATTNEGAVISNGGGATSVTARYIDEAGNPVELTFGQVDVVVREPQIALTKAFAVANADAGDVLTVTVTATNTGTATAYNLRVLDDLVGSDLTALGSVGGTDPPDNIDTTTLGANRPIFSWNPANPRFAIAPGETRSFTFAVRVDTAAQPLEVLDNTIQASWASLPGQGTALNTGGTIGPDGAVNGLRNGALPNAGHAINDHEATASASLSVPAVTLSKTDLAPAIVPTIGAHKQFQIEIRLPEGTTNNVVASDDLAASGLSYVLANNAAFDITYTFEGIATLNGQPPAEAAFNAVPADNTSGTAVWNIGTVVTATENDTAGSAISPLIRIRYHARVNNDLDTDAGDALQNGVWVNYSHGESGAQETLSAATPAVTVVEPRLTLSKTLTNVSPGKQPSDPPVAGDILEYRVVAANTGNAAAFDVNLVDHMPTGVVLYDGFTPTATIGLAPVAGFVATPAGAPAGPLIWGRGNGDGSLDVPAGQTLILTYQARVQIVADPNGLIENGVLADWTSLEADSPYERTGAGCPTITLPNDYCVGPAVATTTGIIPVLEFRKTVINDTTGQNPGVAASPGDTLRYRVQIRNVSAAPVSDFSLVDDLDRLNDPARFVAGTLTLVSVPAGADASNTSPSGGIRGTGLVDVRNLNVGVAGSATDTVAVEFTVQLAPVIPNGAVVLNQGQLTAAGVESTVSDDPNVNGPDDPQVSGDEDPTRTVIASAPAFRVEKTSQDLTGDPTVLFAGDTLRYTITIKNTGTENAVDVTLRDAVPADTTYVPNSTTLNGIAVADPAPGTSPLAGGILIHAPEDSTPGAMRADATDTAANVATVTFEVAVNAGVANGTQIANQGFVNGTGGAGAFPEKPSDDPATPAADDPTVNVVSGLVFQKSVFNVTTGSDGATARPGDTLRYRLDITNSGAVPINNFALVDEIQQLQPGEPLYFVPGTLALVSVPPGADTRNTNPSGGAKGAGLVDVRNLNVAGGGTLSIEFTVRLAPVIANGTAVLNQGEFRVAGVTARRSDDANPALAGDEDPTPTVIQSAPSFRVEKTSQDLTGDPNVLMAGDNLRYTITVKNIGTENAVNVVFRDSIPANSTYVSGTTTLNGVPVADVAGVSPLPAGMLIHAPENATPGAMRADATNTTGNVATITFVVAVDADVVDGTIIANQGFVNGTGTNGNPFPEKPSDDPATPVPDDPTRDIVGNLPLVYAHKTVQIQVDNGSPGIVDPGDVLRYTVTVTNSGAIPATGVVFSDPVPADTTYVADSVRLNGLPVGQPDGGISPLVAGIAISSSDRTPPLPAAGAGTLSPGGSAIVTFDVQVDGAVATGTIISNQGSVATNELPAQLTDADGVSSNGYQPTEVVVGDGQQLRIVKEVFVVGGGAAEAGGQLEYVVRITNISTVPATNVVITDDLSPIGPDPYVPGSATLNGLTGGVSYAAPMLTADYASEYGDLQPGGTAVLRFRVNVPSGVAIGTTITNTAVVTWNTPTQNASGTASVDIGGIPGSAILSGRVWHDADFDNSLDSGERVLAGWAVELYRNATRLAAASTDSAGAYRFSGLAPNDTTADQYEIRFLAPGSGPGTAMLGDADSPFTNGPQRITDIAAGSGSNVLNLNLPIDPNGVVYDSIARTPVAGATVTLLRAATRTALPGGCFADTAQQGQVTLADGYYKFDLNFSDPSCPSGADYLIEVTPPAAYGTAPSLIIPPTSGAATAAYSVPACPDDAVAATDHCEAQGSELAPALGVPPRSLGTRYYLHLTLSNGQVPQDSQVFNNHLPIDPELDAAIAITKTSPLINVTRGQLVPYTITIRNTLGGALQDVVVVDSLPPGFKYIEKSSRFDDNPVEPANDGRQLRWEGLDLIPTEQHTIKLLLVVGSGVAEGEYVNRAQAMSRMTGGDVSGVATATVRVVPDPTFDCTDIIGKVFDDANLDGYPDRNEKGLGSVRVVSARGLLAKTDEHGRFHITCAAIPNPDRGSNFILKVDDRTLPAGYRLTTENPLVLRATRGKAMKFNFGAALHRVVRLDIADGVFEPDSIEVRPQWTTRFGMLLEELRKAPSLLRISYLADVEEPAVVKARLDAIKQEVATRWAELNCCYRLAIEMEIYWRRGGPPDKKATKAGR